MQKAQGMLAAGSVIAILSPISRMSFKWKTGNTKVLWLPVTASTVLAKDSLVTFSSGLLVAATSATAAVDIIGSIVKAITAADTDYATSGRLVPVRVPIEKFTEWEFDTASLVSTDVGAYIDLTDASNANRAASSTDVVLVTKYMSATKGLGVLNIGPR